LKVFRVSSNKEIQHEDIYVNQNLESSIQGSVPEKVVKASEIQEAGVECSNSPKAIPKMAL